MAGQVLAVAPNARAPRRMLVFPMGLLVSANTIDLAPISEQWRGRPVCCSAAERLDLIIFAVEPFLLRDLRLIHIKDGGSPM